MSNILVCLPSRSISQGLRMVDRGVPDYERAMAQHQTFSSRLEEFGYEVWFLEAREQYPDSVFVEDPAVVIPGVAYVRARLKDPSRWGEESFLSEALKSHYPRQHAIQSPGTLEGGDVLVVQGSKTLYAGLSARTNESGILQLADLVSPYGYKVVTIPVAKDKLHLKGECSYHPDTDTIVASFALAPYFKNDTARVVTIDCDDPAERFGANCISRKGRFLVHAGCAAARARLEKSGFTAEFIDLTEYDKIDGAMTCLWKQF